MRGRRHPDERGHPRHVSHHLRRDLLRPRRWLRRGRNQIPGVARASRNVVEGRRHLQQLVGQLLGLLVYRGRGRWKQRLLLL